MREPIPAPGHWQSFGVVRDFRFAWRSLRRAPLAALTIVATLGIGLGLVAVVFTVLNTLIFRADDVRDPHELFAVVRARPADAEPAAFTTREGYEALVRETGVFSEAFAETSDLEAWLDGVKREGRLVTGNAFEVLGVTAARGRALAPSDDEPGRPPVIVLSHRSWTQHFASDSGIVNRAVRLNGVNVQVVGVMPQSFRGLGFAAPDYWAPLSLFAYFHPAASGTDTVAGVNVVGRLAPGVSPGQAAGQLTAWDERRTLRRPGEPPAPPLALEPKPGIVPLSGDTLAVFIPLLLAFGLVLLIGCANVANLLLARGVARQREIGIRLAIGASRGRVVGQLLIESLLLALAAAGLALGLSQLALRGLVYAAVTSFPPAMGNLRLTVPEADWRVAVFLVAGAFVSTLLFALVPALQATRIELVRAIRGEVVADARPGRLRSILVVMQVAASVLLLTCAAVFLRSTWAAIEVESGLRIDGVVTMNVLDERRRGAVLEIANTEPAVEAVAAAWPGVLSNRPLTVETDSRRTATTYQMVSPEYFRLLGVALVRGRGFPAVDQGASAGVAVISESVANRLWPGRDPIGESLRLESEATPDARVPDGPSPVPRQVVIAGVVRDVAGVRLGGSRLGGAGVYLPIGVEAARASLVLLVRGDAEGVRATVVDRLARLGPNLASVDTLQTVASIETYLLGTLFWLTLGLGLLALALTVSGLFSVLSYLAEQRTREIGVRMALGATRGSVAALMLAQLVRPIALGLFVGGSLAAALGGVLRAAPAAAAIGDTVRLLDPLAYAGSLLVIVCVCACATLIPALRAGRIDPMGAIRGD